MFPFNLFKRKKPKKKLSEAESNDQVRATILAMGDDGTAPRHVVHYAYPLGSSIPEDRQRADKWLAALGFRVKNSATGNGVMFENEQPVAGAEFDALTEKLVAFFDELEWEYDGWECAVIQNSAA